MQPPLYYFVSYGAIMLKYCDISRNIMCVLILRCLYIFVDKQLLSGVHQTLEEISDNIIISWNGSRTDTVKTGYYATLIFFTYNEVLNRYGTNVCEQALRSMQ